MGEAHIIGNGSYSIPLDVVDKIGNGDRVKGVDALRRTIGRGVRLFDPEGNELDSCVTSDNPGGIKGPLPC